MNGRNNTLGWLLKQRADRLWRQGDHGRAAVAYEDYVRWRQGWRRPWYTTTSNENGYPPKWTVRA